MLSLFLSLFISQFVLSDELKFYILPTPHGMNWDSPRKLLTSSIKNKLSGQRQFLGHVTIEVSCTNPKWQMRTGMRSNKFDVFNQLLWRGIGLGVIFHSFEGELESAEKSTEVIKLSNQMGSFISYNITHEQCAHVKKYFEIFKEKKLYHSYGLVHRPLMGEGSGCSAFAMSFLKVLGVSDSNLDHEWGRVLKVPLRLMGPPVTNHYIPLWRIYFSGDWMPASDGKEVFFYDPDKMHYWVKKVRAEEPEKASAQNGLKLDLSLIPLPVGPMFEQHKDEMYNPDLKEN